jgi:hypothetical protein
MGLGFIREEPEALQLLVSCRTNIHLKFQNLSNILIISVYLFRYALFYNKFLLCSRKYILNCNYM